MKLMMEVVEDMLCRRENLADGGIDPANLVSISNTRLPQRNEPYLSLGPHCTSSSCSFHYLTGFTECYNIAS